MTTSPKAFRDALIQALREGGYDGEIEYDQERDRLVLPEHGEIGLATLYNDLGSRPAADRSHALAQVARMMLAPLDLPGTWQEARTEIVPWVEILAVDPSLSVP